MQDGAHLSLDDEHEPNSADDAVETTSSRELVRRQIELIGEDPDRRRT